MYAKFIKTLDNFKGSAALYEVEPPIEYDDGTTSFIVVSAVCNEWAHETYIFAADESGKVVDWSEREGSLQGTTSHLEALTEAGYTDLNFSQG